MIYKLIIILLFISSYYAEAIAINYDKSTIRYYGMVIGETKKNKLIETYSELIKSTLGEKQFNLGALLKRDIANINSSFKLNIITHVLNDTKTEMICFKYNAKLDDGRLHDDCFFIAEGIFVGFMVNRTQSKCYEACTLIWSEINHLKSFQFKVKNTLKNEGAQWFLFKRNKLEFNVSVSGLLTTTDSNYNNTYSHYASLCLYPSSLKETLFNEQLKFCHLYLDSDSKNQSKKKNNPIKNQSKQKNNPIKNFKDCDVCPEMVVVPEGKFRMGSNRGNRNEQPAHVVRLANSFAVGKYEITFTEYDAYVTETQMNQPDDEGFGRKTRPVINVSWDDVQGYLSWLSKKTGKNYRLLSEAKWEYVARAGSSSNYYFGGNSSQQCSYANGADTTKNSIGYQLSNAAQCTDGFFGTAPVGSFEPNNFGLYDMLGNASEWVLDCYHKSYEGSPSNGSSWDNNCVTGIYGGKVHRGGAYHDDPLGLRTAARNYIKGSYRSKSIGFRVIRDL